MGCASRKKLTTPSFESTNLAGTVLTEANLWKARFVGTNLASGSR